MAIDINFNDDYKVERKTFPHLHYSFFLAQLLVFLVMMMVLVMLETVISA